MSRHPARLMFALVLLAVGLRWVWNSNQLSGPVVVSLTPSHGVHLNDWVTLLLWSFALLTAFPSWISAASARLCRAVLASPRQPQPHPQGHP